MLGDLEKDLPRLVLVARPGGHQYAARHVDSGSLTATIVALVVAGTANAPTLITGNALVAVVVPAHAVTKAYTWLGVSVFAGIAVGASAGGVLVDGAGAVTALWAATGAGIIAAAVAVTGRRRLQTHTDDRA